MTFFQFLDNRDVLCLMSLEGLSIIATCFPPVYGWMDVLYLGKSIFVGLLLVVYIIVKTERNENEDASLLYAQSCSIFAITALVLARNKPTVLALSGIIVMEIISNVFLISGIIRTFGKKQRNSE